VVKRKKLKVIWDIEAKEHLSEAIAYIRKESLQGAKKVKQVILNTVRSLPDNPEIYEPDRFKEDNEGYYRAVTVYSYRIAYKITEEYILILRVRHTSREPLEY